MTLRELAERWPEYDTDIPDAFDAYIRELTGGYARWPTINLPATFRWHELWERIGTTISARASKDTTRTVEARRAETAQTGSVHDGPTAESRDAQPQPESDNG